MAKNKSKRSAGAPAGSRNPFSKIKTDKLDGAGKKLHANILSKSSPQNRLNTGRSLLSNVVKGKKLRQAAGIATLPARVGNMKSQSVNLDPNKHLRVAMKHVSRAKGR